MSGRWAEPPRILWDGICEKSPSVLQIQIQLGAQVEVEECIDT